MFFLRVVLLSLFLASQLLSFTLEQNYTTQSNNIFASDIKKDIDKDFLLFAYDEGKHRLRVKAKEVVELFKKHGYEITNKKITYVNFTQRSPINSDKIKDALQKEFLSKYPNIRIKSLKVYPRSYTTTLPKIYSVSIPKQALYKNYSTISIKTPKKKMIFFDYELDAMIDVAVSTKNISRHEPITQNNAKIKSVKFTTFRDNPLTDIQNHKYQSKFSIKSDFILTQNDIEILSLVKRDEVVTATVSDGGVTITFNAVAVEDGKEGDVIAVRKSDGKKLMAKVVGIKRVEIQ